MVTESVDPSGPLKGHHIAIVGYPVTSLLLGS